jgi:hypothetical protein
MNMRDDGRRKKLRKRTQKRERTKKWEKTRAEKE